MRLPPHLFWWHAGMGSLRGIIDATTAIFIWNALAPDGWHWLNPDQFHTLRTMVWGFALGWYARLAHDWLRSR